jgi:membrane protein YdbS with pleckstrin-like domain
MDTQSTLQRQFPLSPKKLLEKVITKMFGLYLLVAIAAVVIIISAAVSDYSMGSDVVMILWGILIVMILVVFIITGLYTWYVKVYIRRYYYAGEENFITIKKGVFAPTEIHVQWQKIQDVYVDQDILDRIMGLYDVHIASATASSGIEAHIDGVNQQSAEGLKKFLLSKISGMSNAATQVDATMAAAGQTAPAQAAAQAPATTINLTEELSSDKYPLSGKWTMVTLISRLMGSIGYPFFIILVIFGKSKDITFDENWGYLVLIWAGLAIITMICRTIALFLWKKNYAFKFNPQNIYFREGVISMSEKHMPYSSIQDVTVRQGVVERFFGLAKVVIENAAQQTVMVGRYGQKGAVSSSGIVLQGFSIAEANKIADTLKSTVLGRNGSKYGL